MMRHLIVAEIGKKLFYLRDSVVRVFHDECFPFSLRKCPRVDNISSSLLISIKPSDFKVTRFV
jgi:hypothetical protein